LSEIFLSLHEPARSLIGVAVSLQILDDLEKEILIRSGWG